MRAIRWSTKLLSWLLVATVLGGGMPSRPAWADLVATESIITRAPTPERDRARLRAALGRGDVQARLRAYGVSAEEAAARVDALTDHEVARIADRLDEVPVGAGGDALIGLLLIGPVLLTVGVIFGIGWVIVQIVKGVAQHREGREFRSTVEAATPAKPIEGIVFLEIVSNDDSIRREGYASAERCEEERKRYAHLLGVLWKRMQCLEATR